MKLSIVLLLSLFSSFAYSNYIAEYPTGPDPIVTPGSLCDRPDSYRYSEQIPYCERDVSTDLKYEIFDDYRSRGYRLDLTNRSNYKIDHFIPLCAGGSNHQDNLWPQHISIFRVTDPLESIGCQKLKEGLLTQSKLVHLIRKAKTNVSVAPEIIRYLKSL